jgi:putative membrane protein
MRVRGTLVALLAGALAWSLVRGDAAAVQLLLVFVLVVGLYGGVTTKRSILVVQALPAALALVLARLA